MEEVKKATDVIGRETERAKDRFQEVAEDALKKGREAWQDLRNRKDEGLEAAQERGEEAWKATQQFIRKHPGKAVGIALAVGAVLGVLLTFRNDD